MGRDAALEEGVLALVDDGRPHNEAKPCWSCSARISVRICFCTVMSRADTGLDHHREVVAFGSRRHRQALPCDQDHRRRRQHLAYPGVSYTSSAQALEGTAPWLLCQYLGARVSSSG